MERPEALANAWLLLQTVGFIIALDGVAEFFSVRHYHHLIRQSILFFYYIVGLERDPARPSLPESWEEWYNS